MTVRIVTYRASQPRNVKGTRVETGDTLHAIYVEKLNKFFAWSYVHLESAEHVSKKIASKPLAEGLDLQMNYRANLLDLTPSGVKI